MEMLMPKKNGFLLGGAENVIEENYENLRLHIPTSIFSIAPSMDIYSEKNVFHQNMRLTIQGTVYQ